MPKLLIFDAFTLLIRKKNVANYALLRCKTFSLRIWLCKIFDKYHVWGWGPQLGDSDYSGSLVGSLADSVGSWQARGALPPVMLVGGCERGATAGARRI